MTQRARANPGKPVGSGIHRFNLRHFSEQLTPSYRAALRQANAVIIDSLISSLEDSAAGLEQPELELVQVLPSAYLSECTEQVMRRLLVSFVMVGSKLVAEQDEHLSCVAEEIALLAMVHVAVQILDVSGEIAQFSRWPELGTINQGVQAAFGGTANADAAPSSTSRQQRLPASNWFEPLAPGEAMHPYFEAN